MSIYISNNKSIQKAGAFFSDDKPYYFTNIKYNNSLTNYEHPILQCSICKEYRFKLAVMKIDTQAVAFIIQDSFYGNRVNFFTCVSCGNIHVMSYNTKFTKSHTQPMVSDISKYKTNTPTKRSSMSKKRNISV